SGCPDCDGHSRSAHCASLQRFLRRDGLADRRALAKDGAGYILFNVGSAGIAMVVMLTPTIMAGMTLPLITYLLLRDGYGERSVGYVYAWNTFGSIAGVLAVVHLGLPLLGIKGSLVTGAAIDCALGLSLLWIASSARISSWAIAASTACVIA